MIHTASHEEGVQIELEAMDIDRKSILRVTKGSLGTNEVLSKAMYWP